MEKQAEESVKKSESTSVDQSKEKVPKKNKWWIWVIVALIILGLIFWRFL